MMYQINTQKIPRVCPTRRRLRQIIKRAAGASLSHSHTIDAAAAALPLVLNV
jgi:hypothetical protein